MMGAGMFIRKAILKEKASSEAYVDYLKSKGASIGEDVHIYSPNKTYIDEQFPWMLTIGNHVHITLGCHILNHDYSWAVGKLEYGEVLGGVGQVTIGNNVFIGVNSVILMNTTIGDNVIVGAGSVVKGSIPSNSVVGGAPGKVIATLDKYWEKRKEEQYSEATMMVRRYRERFGKNPPKEKLPAYFFLFEDRNELNNEVFIERMKLCGNYDESLRAFIQSKPMFRNYEEFIASVK